MNAALPTASRPRSRLPRMNLSPNSSLPPHDATVNPPTMPSTPTASDDQHELAQARAEVVVAAGAGVRGELRQQRGLHRLEQQDRDARR